MDFLSYILEGFKQFFPPVVIVAIVCVVFLTEMTKIQFELLERYLESKKGKEIKIFNHTKIIFSIFWSLILSIVLAVSNYILIKELFLYFFVLLGTSNMLYELILKKLRIKEGQ